MAVRFLNNIKKVKHSKTPFYEFKLKLNVKIPYGDR